ncbi:hypothetical protein CR51_06750 [Caballeronia megalochromosomata]|nr:hypothetical protein CR51_06750 [Caballeronia megalochromosomata]
MDATSAKGEELAAVERVANAAREVQLASQSLEEQYNLSTDTVGKALPLARLTAAIGELQSARDALDSLLARKSLP